MAQYVIWGLFFAGGFVACLLLVKDRSYLLGELLEKPKRGLEESRAVIKIASVILFITLIILCLLRGDTGLQLLSVVLFPSSFLLVSVWRNRQSSSSIITMLVVNILVFGCFALLYAMFASGDLSFGPKTWPFLGSTFVLSSINATGTAVSSHTADMDDNVPAATGVVLAVLIIFFLFF